MSADKPTFVIVPGAWHHSSAYERLASGLQAAGHRVTSHDNPSLNSANLSTATREADTAALRELLLSLIEKGQDVVVVAHSYGGLPTQGAAYGLGKTDRSQRGESGGVGGGVIGLVYITAHMMPEGAETSVSEFPPWILVDQPTEGLTSVDNPQDVVYADADPDVAKQVCQQSVRPHALLALTTPTSKPAWAGSGFEGRLASVRCSQDKAMPLVAQDMMREQTGVAWQVETMDCGHSPFVSRTKELVDLILGFTEDFIKAV